MYIETLTLQNMRKIQQRFNRKAIHHKIDVYLILQGISIPKRLYDFESCPKTGPTSSDEDKNLISDRRRGSIGL